MTQLDSILYEVTKPARYTGGEWNSIVKDWEQTPIKIALSYPDVYEIGMSNMAVTILYDLLNRQPDVLAERVFAPWQDMETAMRKADITLFSLESKHPLKDFDVLGFSLGYELTYTNVLNMLDLAQIPILAADRNASHPLVIAGGSCALNPEPMADFIDLFVIGDGEEVILELVEHMREHYKKGKKTPKEALLLQLATIPGIYVPSHYQVEYKADGLVKSITPITPEAKSRIERCIVAKLPPAATKPVVPFIEIVHDRGAIEIQRGCSHGCRFCQAGMVYRPLRFRTQEEIVQAAGELVSNCGYNEVSLVSLSTSDYPHIDELVTRLSQSYPDLALSLPSLHIGSFSIDLMNKLSRHNKPGLTFAPEAGSERLRRSINKDITEEKLLETAAAAFEKGWTGIKLYFMIGLPEEKPEDITEIVQLVDKIRALGPTTGRMPQIRVTISTFVPKAHTPFQWVAQESEEGLNAKHKVLKQGLNRRGIRISWQDPKISQLEAALSRGDRRLGKVIHRAWQSGCTFDSWSEYLKLENWQNAFKETGIDPDFYSLRPRSLDELLPWGHISTGVSTEFLKREYQRALGEQETRNCRTEACNACGLEHSQPECQEKLRG